MVWWRFDQKVATHTTLILIVKLEIFKQKWHFGDFGTKVWIFVFIAFLEKLEHLEVIWHISVFLVWSFSRKKIHKKNLTDSFIIMQQNNVQFYIHIIVQIEFYAFSHIKCFLFSLNISTYVHILKYIISTFLCTIFNWKYENWILPTSKLLYLYSYEKKSYILLCSILNYNIIFARRFCAHIICCIIFHFWGSWANQLILYWDQSLNQRRIVMLHCSGKKSKIYSENKSNFQIKFQNANLFSHFWA